jgi:tRNA pseudouridine55 synthase
VVELGDSPASQKKMENLSLAKKTESSEISGLIPINKPRGMTSKDVSRVLVRRFGKIKLGHVGTLDPDADGVLPILIGRATKLQDYLLDLSKAYSFEMLLGIATDSLDATGKVIGESSWDHVTKGQILKILPTFIGQIEQIPPLYSAVKFKGKELYKYAHAGKTADDVPLDDLQRTVTVSSLTMDFCELPRIGFTVHCGKGTYVRTLAADLAHQLGTVAHVTKLTRTLSAGFSLENCINIEQASDPSTVLKNIVRPIDTLEIGLREWIADDMLQLQRIVDGQHVVISGQQFSWVKEGGEHSVLAKSSSGKSVGILNVMLLPSGEIKLHMKRGI